MWGLWFPNDILFFPNTVSTSNAPADGPTAAVDAVCVPAATFPISVSCYGMSRTECRWHNFQTYVQFISVL